ncbi:MAG: hypothetical protein ABSC90_04780 [Acidimicrobiales bacterium]|jgi:hypothetical protein
MARSWSGTAGYHRGWTGRDYHVTGGHEAEAAAEQEAKKPNRLGLWILRKLGYSGPEPEPPHRAPHHGAPSHPRSPHSE